MLAEEDVVLHCRILDPGLLRDIGNTALGVWVKGERERVEKREGGRREKGGGREERERGREGRRRRCVMICNCKVQ